jgi:hypothetical protein
MGSLVVLDLCAKTVRKDGELSGNAFLPVKRLELEIQGSGKGRMICSICRYDLSSNRLDCYGVDTINRREEWFLYLVLGIPGCFSRCIQSLASENNED